MRVVDIEVTGDGVFGAQLLTASGIDVASMDRYGPRRSGAEEAATFEGRETVWELSQMTSS